MSKSYILIIVLSALLFIPFLGRVPLFDWDELIFAEIAREMRVSGNYEWIRINFQPFWEKPPLFFWLQAGSMAIFGVGEFAARFPNACCGILALCLIYFLGRKFENPRFALCWTAIYALSILPHFYYKTGIIDPWFNLFILIAISSFVQYFHTQQRVKYVLIAGVVLGLATLTKGPVSVFLCAIIIGILSLLIYQNLQYHRFLLHSFYALLLCVAVVSLWLGTEVYANGWWFLRTFWNYQSGLFSASYGGHKGFWGYHFVVLSIGCFPAVALMWNGWKNLGKSNFRLVMLLTLGVVLLVFSIVKTKLVHYSSLCYYPISFFAALGICQYLETKRLNLASKIHLIIGGIVWGGALVALPLILQHKQWLISKISDPFFAGNLQADIDWNWQLSLWGVAYLALFAYAFVNLFRAQTKRTLCFLLIAHLLLIQVILHIWVPRVEKMLQGASIEFWQAHKNENCYMGTLYMWSFAPYFYGKVREHKTSAPYYDNQWLLTGKIDKPAYFMCRNIHKTQVLQNSGADLQLLYEKNGYCFWKREATK